MLKSIKLTPYQTEFVSNFLNRRDKRTLLVAAPGTGKTVTALITANQMIAEGLVDRVLLVASSRALVDEWRHSKTHTVDPSFTERYDDRINSTTYQMLSRYPEKFWDAVPPTTRWLIVFDGVEWAVDRLDNIAATALERFPGSRALFIATTVPPVSVDAKFDFNLAIFGSDALSDASTRSNLTLLAPSIGVLEKIQRKLLSLDDLSWREFEQLIGRMLETDGYAVELMQGSKDGGVDVVAVKDLGDAGLFKSIWQAKKHRVDRKVGLSLVRELADTRQEHGASKAIMVTTSYLTKGALDRVERDRFVLGKVDREDLDDWLERTLRGT